MHVERWRFDVGVYAVICHWSDNEFQYSLENSSQDLYFYGFYSYSSRYDAAKLTIWLITKHSMFSFRPEVQV